MSKEPIKRLYQSKNKGPEVIECEIISLDKGNKNLNSTIKIHGNIDQEIIVVNEDKARLQLMSYQEILKSRYNWQIPLGWIFSFGIAIAGVEKFRAVLIIPAAVCEAVIYIGFVYSVGWFIFCLVNVYKNWKKGGIEELLRRLKSSSSSLRSKKNVGLPLKRGFPKYLGKEVKNNDYT